LKSVVRCQLHKSDFAFNIHFLHKVGSKHERAVQNTQEKGAFIFQIVIDLRGNLFNPVLNILIRNEGSEIQIIHSNYVHAAKIVF